MCDEIGVVKVEVNDGVHIHVAVNEESGSPCGSGPERRGRAKTPRAARAMLRAR